jgi:hypothetical protein
MDNLFTNHDLVSYLHKHYISATRIIRTSYIKREEKEEKEKKVTIVIATSML